MNPPAGDSRYVSLSLLFKSLEDDQPLHTGLDESVEAGCYPWHQQLAVLLLVDDAGVAGAPRHHGVERGELGGRRGRHSLVLTAQGGDHINGLPVLDSEIDNQI